MRHAETLKAELESVLVAARGQLAYLERLLHLALGDQNPLTVLLRENFLGETSLTIQMLAVAQLSIMEAVSITESAPDGVSSNSPRSSSSTPQ